VDDASLQPFYDTQFSQPYKPLLPAQYSVRAINLWGTGRGGVKIVQQYFPFTRSSIDLTYDRPNNVWTLKTQNVRRFSISPLSNNNPAQVPPFNVNTLIIDGQAFPSPSNNNLNVAYYCALKQTQGWSRCDDLAWIQTERSDLTSGPMRKIFETGPVTYVYGTRDGYANWRQNRAWFMASTMFYQGRWGAKIMSDTELVNFPSGTNLILLGGPSENYLTEKLFPQCSMSKAISFLGGQSFSIGGQSFTDPGIGLISFGMFPNGSSPALLVMIAGTDVEGELDAMSLLPLSSGIQIADYAVTGPTFKWRGIGGLLSTGFWSYDFTYRSELSYPRTSTYSSDADTSNPMKLSTAQTVGVLVSSIGASLLIGLFVGTFWCSKFHKKTDETQEYMPVE